MSGEPSTKEVIESMKAINELMKLFKTSEKKLENLLPPFIEAVEGDHVKWFQGIEKVSDLSQDDAHGCLIVACSALAQLRVKTRDTPAGEAIRELFKSKES